MTEAANDDAHGIVSVADAHRSRSATILRAALIVAFLAFVVALVAWPIVFEGYTTSNAFCAVTNTPPYGDAVTPLLDPGAAASQDEPWLLSIRRAMEHGYVPLVNFDNGLGAPMLESLQAGALYLGNPVLLLFDDTTPWLFDAFALLHVLLYTAGLYALTRLHARTGVALATAILVGLSGISLQHLDMVHFRAHAWLPWILWAATRLARGESRRAPFVVLAVAHVGLVTSGALQEAFVCSLFACVVFAIELFTRPATHVARRSSTATFVTVLIASTAVASVAVVPYLVARANGDVSTASWPGRSVEALPRYGLANVFLPHASGFHPFWLGPTEGRWMTDFSTLGAFLVVSGLVLAILDRAAESHVRRRRWWYATCVLVGLAKLQGLFVFDVLKHVPFVAEILFVKYHGWLFDAFAIVSASAVEGLLTLERRSGDRRAPSTNVPSTDRTARRTVGIAFVVTALVTVVFVWGTWSYAASTGNTATLSSFPADVRRDAAWTYGAALCAFVAAAIVLFARPKRTDVWLVAIVVAQVALVRPNGWLPRAAGYADANARIERAEPKTVRLARRQLSNYPPNQNAMLGFPVLGVFDPVCNARFQVLMNGNFKVENPEFILHPTLGANPIDARRMALLRFMGVEVVYEHAIDPSITVKRTRMGGAIVPDPLPRVWLLDEKDAERLESGAAGTSMEERIDAISKTLRETTGVTDVLEVGNALVFRAPADFRGQLVVQQAFSHAWRFEGEAGRPYFRLFPSWDVSLTKGGAYRVEYRPAGLAAATWIAVGGLAVLLVGAWRLGGARSGRTRPDQERCASSAAAR